MTKNNKFCCYVLLLVQMGLTGLSQCLGNNPGLDNFKRCYPLKVFFLFLSEFMIWLKGVSADADVNFLTKQQT